MHLFQIQIFPFLAITYIHVSFYLNVCFQYRPTSIESTRSEIFQINYFDLLQPEWLLYNVMLSHIICMQLILIKSALNLLFFFYKICLIFCNEFVHKTLIKLIYILQLIAHQNFSHWLLDYIIHQCFTDWSMRGTQLVVVSGQYIRVCQYACCWCLKQLYQCFYSTLPGPSIMFTVITNTSFQNCHQC